MICEQCINFAGDEYDNTLRMLIGHHSFCLSLIIPGFDKKIFITRLKDMFISAHNISFNKLEATISDLKDRLEKIECKNQESNLLYCQCGHSISSHYLIAGKDYFCIAEFCECKEYKAVL